MFLSAERQKMISYVRTIFQREKSLLPQRMEVGAKKGLLLTFSYLKSKDLIGIDPTMSIFVDRRGWLSRYQRLSNRRNGSSRFLLRPEWDADSGPAGDVW